MCFGTRTRSSIKSTSALSTTATVMASVIFKGLKRSSTTSRNWGSARYGSCHSSPLLCATMATTLPITTQSIPATEHWRISGSFWGQPTKLPEILQCSIAGMDCVVIGNVVAIVAQRRGEEWHEPYRADPQFLEVVELRFKPLKITDAITVAVVESADVDLIDDRVLVPKHIPA